MAPPLGLHKADEAPVGEQGVGLGTSAGVGGKEGFVGADVIAKNVDVHGPFPAALVARTAKPYGVDAVKPVTTHDVLDNEHTGAPCTTPATTLCASYSSEAEPPASNGVTQVSRTAPPETGAPVASRGSEGTDNAVVVTAVAKLQSLSPMLFDAVTTKEYVVA